MLLAGVQPEGVYVLRARGESMIGLDITDGDRLLVERDAEPVDRDIVVVLVGDGTELRRLRLAHQTCILESGDDAEPPVIVERAALQVLGVAQAAISVRRLRK